MNENTQKGAPRHQIIAGRNLARQANVDIRKCCVMLRGKCHTKKENAGKCSSPQMGAREDEGPANPPWRWRDEHRNAEILFYGSIRQSSSFLRTHQEARSFLKPLDVKVFKAQRYIPIQPHALLYMATILLRTSPESASRF